jgi:MFS family permease
VAAGDAGLPPERAAALVSLMGLAGTAGRVAFGRIADHPRVDKVLLFQVSLMLAGGAVLLFAAGGRGSPAAPGAAAGDATFAVFAAGALLFGLFSGAIVSQVPVIMAERLGLESLPAAMGGSYTIQAPAVLACPPLAGAARAAYGNYYGVFIVIGLAMTLSPLVLYAMPGRGCGGRAATRLK